MPIEERSDERRHSILERALTEADPVVPVAELREYASPAQAAAQVRSHVLALAGFHRDNGTKLDPTGRPVLRASEQRKNDAKVVEIRELASLAAGSTPAAPVKSKPAGDPNALSPEAALRVLSIYV